ncbi:MAG: FtsW/RodA/SpoVE family cell cycle protein [Candidatus Nanopelagicales bacterium]
MTLLPRTDPRPTSLRLGRRDRLHAARLDWVLVAAALALSLLGCALIASAGEANVGSAPAKRQLLSVVVAVMLAFVVTRVEPRSLRAWTPALYLASLVGQLLPFTPMGVSIAGARAWFALPLGFTVQPSEFAKLALICALAATLAGGPRDQTVPDAIVVRGLALAALPLAIVLVGNDTGSAMVITGIVAVIMLVAGVSWKWLAGLAAVGVLVATAAISLGLLADYQMRRLTSFLDPMADPYGAGLNTIQARIAVGSGGVVGRGLFQGPQTQGGFVPVNDSDFVFSVAAEELGLIGGLLLLILLGIILWRGLRIAFDARDMFGRLIAVGVVAWFALQAFENIGMNLGVMPVTGVTLPFRWRRRWRPRRGRASAWSPDT